MLEYYAISIPVFLSTFTFTVNTVRKITTIIYSDLYNSNV